MITGEPVGAEDGLDELPKKETPPFVTVNPLVGLQFVHSVAGIVVDMVLESAPPVAPIVNHESYAKVG